MRRSSPRRPSNVGIGTTSPSVRLQVNVASQSVDGIVVAAPDNASLFFGPSRGSGGSNSLVQAADSSIIYSKGALGTGALVIGPWSTTAAGLRLDSAGNVGIGMPTPASELHVNGVVRSDWDSTPSWRAQLELRRLSDGVFDGSAFTVDIGMGAGLTNLVAGARLDATGSGHEYLGLRGAAKIGMYDGSISLSVGATAGTAATPVTWVDALSVDSTGKVGIGTTAPTATLEVNGDALIRGGVRPDYDSGWFAVSTTAQNTKTLAHGLGVFPSRTQIYTSNSATPTWIRPSNLNSAGVPYTAPESTMISTSDIQLSLCCSDYVIYCDVNNPCPSGVTTSTSGYMRVLLWK